MEQEEGGGRNQLAERMIDKLCDEGMLKGCLIGKGWVEVEEDEVSIRWPDARLFCDITKTNICISKIPQEPARLEDVKFKHYNKAQIKEACQELSTLMWPADSC